MSRMLELIFSQIEIMAEDDDRPVDEQKMLLLMLRELKAEFARLSKGDLDVTPDHCT